MTLSEKVVLYQEGKDRDNKIFNEVCKICYAFPRKETSWNEDQRSDFFLWIYPKISKIMKKYDYGRRVTFGHFLKVVLKKQIATYLKRNRKAFYQNGIILDEEALADMICSPHLPYRTPEEEFFENEVVEVWKRELKELQKIVKRLPHQRALKKRVLILFLISVKFQLTDGEAEAFAEFFSLNKEVLKEYLASAEKVVQVKLERRQPLLERKNRLYSKLTILEVKEKGTLLKEDKKRCRDKIRIAKKRLSKVNSQLAKWKISPSHREISLILGIPVGTVNSSMMAMKKKIGQLKCEIAKKKSRNKNSL